MKIQVNNGTITATPENQREIEAVLRMSNEGLSLQKDRKPYKRQMPKTCQDCGRVCKGNLGLSIHKAIHRNRAPITAQPVPQA